MVDWLLRRWHLKLLALALAFAVWIAVTGEGRGVLDFRVPVDVVLGTGATLAGTPPANVTVRLRGPDSLLRRMDAYDLTIRVDLRDAGGGERTVQLTARNVAGVPRDVEVAAIDPDRLRLTIAKKKRREVPVVPTIVGKPPRGYQVYRAIARPEALLVEGPETRISAVSRLNTDPIRVDLRSEPFTARVGAVPDGSDLRVVDARPLDVMVYIDLAAVDATIDRVPVVAAGASGSVVTVPSTIAVTVQAPSALIPKLRAGHIRAVVDLNGSAALPFVAGAPLRIELPGLDPEERAKVTIRSLSRKKVDVRRSPR
jgi:YbbR domain-containing protein